MEIELQLSYRHEFQRVNYKLYHVVHVQYSSTSVQWYENLGATCLYQAIIKVF